MSIAMYAKVWQIELDPTNKMVLLRLAENVNKEGTTAWPSVELISHECCINRRTVQRCLRRLEELGLIEALTPATRYGSVVYSLHPERGVKLPPLQPRNGRRGLHVAGGVGSTLRAAWAPNAGGVRPPEPEENREEGTGTVEPAAPTQSSRPPNPPLSRGALRALNGSGRRRDQQALANERPDSGEPDDRYFRGRYGAILRQRLEEGSTG